MSMREALRPLRGLVPWLTEDSEVYEPPVPPTPLESAEALVITAKNRGLIDRASPTWVGIASWAAHELILVRDALETANEERSTALRARAKTLRDVLAAGEHRESNTVIADPAPDIP